MKRLRRSGIAVLVGIFCGAAAIAPASGQTRPKAFTLDEVVSLGLERNFDVLAAGEETAAREAAWKASRRLPNPSLDLHAGGGETLGAGLERNTSGITLSQYLENPFKRHYRVRTFELDWLAAGHAEEARRLEAVFRVESAFYRILYLDRHLELAESNLESAASIETIVRRRADLGEVKELEALKLRVEALRAQNHRDEVRGERDLAREELNRIVGYALPPDFEISGDLARGRVEIPVQALVETAVGAHPEVRRLQKLVEESESRRSEIRWRRFPDFRLSGFRSRELDGKVAGVGLSFDLPLWNFHSAEAAEADAEARRRGRELDDLRAALTLDVRRQVLRLDLAARRVALFEEGLLREAEESLNIARLGYEHGEIALVDYLDSRRTFITVSADYYASLLDWNLERAALEKAVGGKL